MPKACMFNKAKSTFFKIKTAAPVAFVHTYVATFIPIRGLVIRALSNKLTRSNLLMIVSMMGQLR